MVDPRHCPIPPGFNVWGKISDDFEYWNYLGIDQHTTTYSSTGRIGYSHRWDNSNVRSANIVAGFQFRIGPHIAQQWKVEGEFHNEQIIYYEITHADVDLKLPRMRWTSGDPTNRGVYILTIRSFTEGNEDEGLQSRGFAGKEFPHPNTTGFHFIDFGISPESDPKPDIGQIRDGEWHSFVAAVWNGGPFLVPTMALWYNPNPTYDWNDFVFLGWSEDKPPHGMPPDGPLFNDIENDRDHDIFDNPITWIKAAHVVQIRIDGIATEEVGVRNMYAANVGFIPGAPPVIGYSHPTLCKGLLATRGIKTLPISIRFVAEHFGLTLPISVKDLIERLQKNIL